MECGEPANVHGSNDKDDDGQKQQQLWIWKRSRWKTEANEYRENHTSAHMCNVHTPRHTLLSFYVFTQLLS